MKTTVFMPIKLNNERTPGKNLKKFDDGTVLLQVPLKTALEAKKETRIFGYSAGKVCRYYRGFYKLY